MISSTNKPNFIGDRGRKVKLIAQTERREMSSSHYRQKNPLKGSFTIHPSIIYFVDYHQVMNSHLCLNTYDTNIERNIPCPNIFIFLPKKPPHFRHPQLNSPLPLLTPPEDDYSNHIGMCDLLFISSQLQFTKVHAQKYLHSSIVHFVQFLG